MKKLVNGKETSVKSIVEMMEEGMDTNWEGSDLYRESELVFEKIASEDYEGKSEDLEYIVEGIENNANLQDVEDIIKSGKWYFGKYDFFQDETNDNLKVWYEFEDEEYTGIVEFENLENGKIFISFSTDNNGQVVENGMVDAETAADIKHQILSRNYNMTDFEIF